jgi:DNA polymerase-3 subunit alpha
MDRRGEVIDYVTQKYGTDHVAQIITFGTMAAKAAIRDVGRVLDIPYAEVDKVAKLVPTTLNITLDEAVAQEPRLKELADTDPKIGELLSLARSLEGITRHASTHAAGVVISKAPLTEHVPLYRGVNGETVTQFAMSEIEKIGLVKFDFLGLRTLTVIDHALKILNARRPGDPPLAAADIALDDAKTYELLGTGQTTGIFQLESSGMRDLLVKMRPERFEDLIAILALYRPGPIGSGMLDDFIKRKRGQTKIQYELPELEDLLKETYGVIVYQEQVMKIANRLAGFSLGDADLLRRAMGKKLPEEMEKQKTLFIAGAAKNGFDPKKAEKIFDLMAYFAGYGFNKSHSAAYALITYQTAYLKAHHPLEFMAALLTSEMGNEDKIVQYIAECRAMGIAILPPDVNESNQEFTIADQAIRFGLVAVKNVGASAIESVLNARAEHGRFRSLSHFCREVDLRKVNRRVIESLIKCGAFASTRARRAQLMDALDRTMEAAAGSQSARRAGQETLFGGSGDGSSPDDALPDVPEWDDATLARSEKESLGFYITSHPLSPYAREIERFAVTPTDRLADAADGDDVRVWGVLASKKITTTRKGDRMAYVRVEDLAGSVETIVFPDLYAASGPLLASDQPLVIDGTLDKGDKGVKLKATRIMSLESARERAGGHLEIVLDEDVGADGLRRLKATLARHPGTFPVWLRVLLKQQGRESTIVAGETLRVNPTRTLLDEIEAGFGKGSACVRSDPNRGLSRPPQRAPRRRAGAYATR